MRAAFARNTKLEIVWDLPRGSENELGTGERNIRHNAIDNGRAIVKDNLRAQTGSRPLAASCFRHGDRPLGIWLPIATIDQGRARNPLLVIEWGG